jgi:hypothetical protein
MIYVAGNGGILYVLTVLDRRFGLVIDGGEGQPENE